MEAALGGGGGGGGALGATAERAGLAPLQPRQALAVAGLEQGQGGAATGRFRRLWEGRGWLLCWSSRWVRLPALVAVVLVVPALRA